MASEIGDVNPNEQKLLAKTPFDGTDYNQKIWAVQCQKERCGHVYGVNGSDFHLRKCPKCDGGKPGI
jgi:Zn finger protein HypA/HybF involved in hydrogenase expression